MAKKSETSKPTTEGEATTASPGLNPMQFLQDSKTELSKVVWPSRQQLINESLAVILMVSLSATIIYLVNNFFDWAASKVFLLS
jgi:preprotein translocase subunit SecE